MTFNSIEFLIFLPSVFLLYWFVFQKNLKLQNILLLVSSYLFYGWWDWRFLSLIIFSTVVDYYVGLSLKREEKVSKRKLFLFLSIFVNLGLLGFFKYYNFFVDSWVTAWSGLGFEITSTSTLNIILPVGISFYTFQTMSYSLDIYWKKLEPTRDFLAFATFVSFFPQLVAGPIERASHLLPQILNRRSFSNTTAQEGFHLIVWGLFQKVCIGDNLGVLVDQYYGNVGLYSSNWIMSVLMLVFYSFQIYCDFAGYSNIAIGVSKLLGIELNTNFRRPYFSTSFSEFWRRWHISLSTWLRDYLYIPLGGNRGSKYKTYRNLIITMLLGGLWHGASFNFVVWGAIHGLYLAVERALSPIKFTIWKPVKMVMIFLLVALTWIPFRATSFSDTWQVLTGLLDFSLSFNLPIGMFDLAKGLFLVVILLGFDVVREWELKWNKPAISMFLTLLLLLLGNWSANNFIYFQF